MLAAFTVGTLAIGAVGVASPALAQEGDAKAGQTQGQELSELEGTVVEVFSFVYAKPDSEGSSESGPNAEAPQKAKSKDATGTGTDPAASSGGASGSSQAGQHGGSASGTNGQLLGLALSKKSGLQEELKGAEGVYLLSFKDPPEHSTSENERDPYTGIASSDEDKEEGKSKERDQGESEDSSNDKSAKQSDESDPEGKGSIKSNNQSENQGSSDSKGDSSADRAGIDGARKMLGREVAIKGRVYERHGLSILHVRSIQPVKKEEGDDDSDETEKSDSGDAE